MNKQARIEKRMQELRRRILGACSVRHGIEVGVWRGDTASRFLQWFPDMQLTLVDAWSMDGVSQEYRETARFCNCDSQNEWDEVYEGVRDRFLFSPRVNILRCRSPEAARHVQDSSQDFVYLDASHDRESVMSDLRAWWPKLRAGGVMSGDDYNSAREVHEGKEGVKVAVDEFALDVQRRPEVWRRVWSMIK